MDETSETTKVTNLTPIKRRCLDVYKQGYGNITNVCRSCGISRQTYYTWLKEDQVFADAIKDFEHELNDELKAKLFDLAKLGNITAIIFWLRRRHPDFMDPYLVKAEKTDLSDMKIEFVETEAI